MSTMSSVLQSDRALMESGRKLGVKQAMAFLLEVHDQPTLASDVGKYLLPSRQWRKNIVREQWKSTTSLTAGEGVCPKCKGTKQYDSGDPMAKVMGDYTCETCHGTGYV